MPFQMQTFYISPKPFSALFLVLVSILLILSHGSITAADKETTNIGAIIDLNSRSGKEQEVAMKIAVHSFNHNSKDHKLTIHFRNTSGDPIQSASAAEELIREKQVQVIIGMQTWQESVLVADVGKRAQVPVISFAAAAITPPSTQLRWPFLVQMATNGSAEINCIAAIINYYNWKRVIAIYEDDIYGGESGTLALLSEALQSVGSEIEYRLLLPPFSSLSDPKGFIGEEVANLMRKESRVFIVLQSSVPMATHLFKEAKEIGLMRKDSVWIITDTVSSLLDSVDNSVISSMQGVLGTKTYYSQEVKPFLDFKARFQIVFRLEYQEEDSLEPGIHALRAYDSINIIAMAVRKFSSNGTSSSKFLLKGILSSNFTGLSGNIKFQLGMLSDTPVFRIINIFGMTYKELGFWSSEFRFSENLSTSRANGGDSMKTLTGVVNWSGDQVPKGWAMPTLKEPMKIGVPGRTSFQKFVKVEEDPSKENYTGFCIDVFKMVIKNLSYTLPYTFVPYNGTYEDLIDHVINKTFDAIIGDVTILANRSRYVEFTQPYAESGLSMLVPVKSEAEKALMFTKPFTMELWIVTLAILIYTMFIVWFLEHQSNPEFRGPWKDQVGTALWFTFSSLFFSHSKY